MKGSFTLKVIETESDTKNSAEKVAMDVDGFDLGDEWVCCLLSSAT